MDNKNFLYKFETKDKDNAIRKYGVLKPNRKMREDGELFYSVEVSKYAKAGILPKAAWNTILSNGGGSISDKEREIYGNLLVDFRDKSFELQAILIKNITERTEVEKKRSDELLQELDEIKKEIQAFESSQISIFENTAESKARNRSILWWVLNLSYHEKDGQYTPIFEGTDFDVKLDLYDSYEDDYDQNEFLLGVIRRLTYLVTLWFLGRAEKESDFQYFDNLFIEEHKDSEDEIVENPPVEETKKEEITKKIEEPAKEVSEPVIPVSEPTPTEEKISTTNPS
jgi:hypothetical protein